MKNNNRDYTELQLHYLDLDEYICENIYPINNIVFTEKINWLTGLAAVGGAVALGFLIKFIWKSITNNNINRENINKAKEATKKQEEKNEQKKAEANLNPEQEQKLDKINNASATEIKENIIPSFEQSEEKPPVTSKNSEKEISSKPNNDQQSNKNPIASDKQSSETAPEKTEEELQKELTELNQKNKESEQRINELKAQNANQIEKIRQLGQSAFNSSLNSIKNNIDKTITVIGSLENEMKQCIKQQAQIVSQDQHKNLEDKKIDQDKIETKPLPVENIKENYDEEFNNFIDLYNENMKIINFTLQYISYHYNDLKTISIDFNKNKNSLSDDSPLGCLLWSIDYILSNLDNLINVLFRIDINFQVNIKNNSSNDPMDPKYMFNINANDESFLIASYKLDSVFYDSDRLNKYPWLNIYADLIKEENYNMDYCIFKKGVYEKILQQYENTYKDTELIKNIDNDSGYLNYEYNRFEWIKTLLTEVPKSSSNFIKTERIKTFIKLRKEQLKSYLIDQVAQQNNQ